MGGLLTRYYLRYGSADSLVDGQPPALNWSGAKDIDRVILIGTPNNGSAKSMVTTRDAEFTDNALYLLLEDPTKSSPSRLMREPTFGE